MSGEAVAAIVFGALMLTGLILLIWDRPWKALDDRIERDEDGRPTDEHPTGQAFHDARAELREAVAKLLDALRDALAPSKRDDDEGR